MHLSCTHQADHQRPVEVRQIMGIMSQVVEAMLERLRVDLTEDEIAVALQAFNIPLWQDTSRREPLLGSVRKLCAMLSLPPRTAEAIGQFARALHPLLQAAKAECPEVGNKHAWSWVLRPVWRARHAHKIPWTEACHTLIAFYLSLKINTTTLERDLGQLLMQLEAHSGPLTPNGSTIASILEVAIEGPQQEEEFFQKPQEEGGVLTPTDFGVLCGELWIRYFGRRFRCTYMKESKAAPRNKPREKRAGTLSSVVRGRAAAALAVTQAATAADRKGRTWKAASFVPGLSLPLPSSSGSAQSAVAGTRWAFAKPTLEEQKHLQKFRQRTRQKSEGIPAASFAIFCLFRLTCSNQGHQATAQRRASGRVPYTVTNPRLGGLRMEQRGDEQTLLQHILSRRTIRLCLVYRRYSDSKPLERSRLFDILPLHDYANADIVVVDRMSDVETVRNDQLVALLVYAAASRGLLNY